jgi:DHA2 family multidrug resistance protein
VQRLPVRIGIDPEELARHPLFVGLSTTGLMGYRAVDAGMVLTPGGVVMILLMPLMGRMVDKVDVRLLVAIGLGVGGLSLLWMTRFYLDISFGDLVLARIVQAIALAFLFVPLNSIAVRGIPADKTNNASALINSWA